MFDNANTTQQHFVLNSFPRVLTTKMSEKEIDENATTKEQKEEENEKIKTEKQEKTGENQEQDDDENNQNEAKPGLEVIKETQSVIENPHKETEEKNGSNKSEKAAENIVESAEHFEKLDLKGTTTTDKKEKQEIPVEKLKPVAIDLKAVQTHYRTHTKTTLPHLLTEYGFEDKSHPKKFVQKDKEKEKQKKKRVEIVETSDDEDRHTRKVREEKFSQMFGDNRNFDEYYAEYLDFLHEKVIKQRLQAQRRKEEEERLAALREEEELYDMWDQKQSAVDKPQFLGLPEEMNTNSSEDGNEINNVRKTRHDFTRRLTRIELTHDDSFLKDLPKTDLARIVKLQDKMKREGKLKTQADVDKFWSDIRDPDVFYDQFKVKRTFDPGPSPLRKPLTPKPDHPPRSLSHISESSRGEEPWAITQKYQSVHGHKTPTVEKTRKDSAQLAKEAASDLEKRCPKLEMPPLACFSLKLGEKPPDPAEVQKKVELKAREKNRKKFQRKLRKMYQMAMTNSAASNRILAQHGDLTAIMDGAILRDVRNFCCEPRELAVFDEPYTLEQHYRDLTDPTRQLDQFPDRISEASHTTQGSRRSTASSRGHLTPISQTGRRSGSFTKGIKKSPEMLEAPSAPVPLSFDDVLSREKTIEAKCVSVYWSNYMNAGKSVFAPT